MWGRRGSRSEQSIHPSPYVQSLVSTHNSSEDDGYAENVIYGLCPPPPPAYQSYRLRYDTFEGVVVNFVYLRSCLVGGIDKRAI